MKKFSNMIFSVCVYTYLGEKASKVLVEVVGFLGGGVKVLLTRTPIQVESSGRGSDVMYHALKRGHFQIGQVA